MLGFNKKFTLEYAYYIFIWIICIYLHLKISHSRKAKKEFALGNYFIIIKYI